MNHSKKCRTHGRANLPAATLSHHCYDGCRKMLCTPHDATRTKALEDQGNVPENAPYLVATRCYASLLFLDSCLLCYYLFVAECWAPAELLGSSRAPSLNSLGLRSSSTLTKNINRATCQELEFETSVLGHISEAFTQWSSESCTTRRDHGQNFESVHRFTRSKPIHNMRKNEFELTCFCTLGSVSGSFDARR